MCYWAHAAQLSSLPTLYILVIEVVIKLSSVCCCCFFVQEPACAVSDMQRSVVAGVVHQAAQKARLATYGLNSIRLS